MDEAKRKQLEAERADDVLPEYDFSGRTFRRAEFYKDLQQNGHTVTVYNEDGMAIVTYYSFPPPRPNLVVLEPDVEAYFPDSESVNTALRGLIALIPAHKARQKAKKVAGPRKKRRLDL